MPGRVTSGAPVNVEPEVESPDESAATNQVCSFASQASYDTGYALSNPHADPQPVGTNAEMARQALAMSLLGGGAAGDHAVDLDDLAHETLSTLSPTPPDLSKKPEIVEYTSTLHNVAPQDAYEFFKKNPADWFGASGITLHPPVKELVDGARVMLEEPGVTPPVWMPVEVHLDDANRSVEITTLDGHPLRGFNQFTFDTNGSGETVMRQTSTFQLSSPLARAGIDLLAKGQEAGLPVTDALERQHAVWRDAHAYVADHAPRR